MAWQTVDGQAVVMDLAGGRVLGFNAVGSLVWALLAGGKALEEIAQRVAERFEVDAARARADVGAFLDKLRELQLVAPGPAGSSPAGRP